MELIKHELYKILRNKSIIVLLIIVAVLNVITFGAQLHYGRVDKTVINSLTKELEGEITNSKLDKAHTWLEQLEDMKPMQSPEVMFQLKQYRTVMSINSAYYIRQEKLRDFIENPNGTGFSYKNSKLLYSMVNATLINEYHYTAGWDDIIGYVDNLGAIIIAAFILLGLSAMFCGEYTSGMDAIILSSKFGKTKLIRAKLISVIIYVLSLIVFFSILNFVEVAFVSGIRGWNAPMQCLTAFMYSPYKLTVLQYYLVQLGVHSIACVAFGLFIALASTLCKTRVATFFTGLFVFVTPYIIDNVIPMKKTLAELITKLSYSWAMQVEKLFNSFRTFNILDNPMTYPVIAIFLMVISIVLSCIYINRIFKNHGMNF